MGATPHQRRPNPPPSCSRELSFKPADFAAKPLLEDLQALTFIQSSDGSALLIEWDVVARNIFASIRLRDVLHENTFTARMTTQRISEIQAGERVLEGRCGLVWRTN
jgi:hypothetical protein